MPGRRSEGEFMRLHLSGSRRALARVPSREHLVGIVSRDPMLSVDLRPGAAAGPALSWFPL